MLYSLGEQICKFNIFNCYKCMIIYELQPSSPKWTYKREASRIVLCQMYILGLFVFNLCKICYTRKLVWTFLLLILSSRTVKKNSYTGRFKKLHKVLWNLVGYLSVKSTSIHTDCLPTASQTRILPTSHYICHSYSPRMKK